MTKKKRGLGRGLDALLTSSRAQEVSTSEQDEDIVIDAAADLQYSDGELRRLPVEWLQPGRYQPRKDIQPEGLEELAASIKAQGLMRAGV